MTPRELLARNVSALHPDRRCWFTGFEFLAFLAVFSIEYTPVFEPSQRN